MTVQSQKMLVAGIAVLSFILTYGQNREAPIKLTIDEAGELVMAAAPLKMRALPGFHLEYFSRSPCPEFYYFDARWKNPGTIGSSLSARYAVNSTNGDVWEPDTPMRITSPELEKAQKLARQRLGLSSSEYRKLKKKYPC